MTFLVSFTYMVISRIHIKEAPWLTKVPLNRFKNKLHLNKDGFSRNTIIIVFPNLKCPQVNCYVKIYSIKIMKSLPILFGT